MKIFNINLRLRAKSMWSDLTIKLLPKHLGIEFNKGVYIKTTSGVEPWYWYVTLNLIWFRITLFCEIHYKHIFKLKIKE